jgi:hypothetical protein
VENLSTSGSAEFLNHHFRSLLFSDLALCYGDTVHHEGHIKSIVSGGSCPYIGTAGFTPPDLTSLRYSPANSFARRDNLNIICPPGAHNNWIVASDDWVPVHPLVIRFGENATDNTLVFDSGSKIYGSMTVAGHRNTALFSCISGHASQLTLALYGDDDVFLWGKDTTSNGVWCDLLVGSGHLIIGDDCMFAREISLRTMDSHAMFSIETLKRLNEPASILIEPHVWVAHDATISKGLAVGLGSIVAAKGFVTKDVPRYSLVGGLPARVMQTGVTWDRHMMPRPATLAHLRDLESKMVVPAPRDIFFPTTNAALSS